MAIEILDKMPEKIDRPTFHIYPVCSGQFGFTNISLNVLSGAIKASLPMQRVNCCISRIIWPNISRNLREDKMTKKKLKYKSVGYAMAWLREDDSIVDLYDTSNRRTKKGVEIDHNSHSSISYDKLRKSQNCGIKIVKIFVEVTK